MFSLFDVLFSRCSCYSQLHRVSKNVPSLACYKFDTCERILIFLAEMLAVKQGIERRFTITCAVLSGKTGKHESCIFTQMLYYCIARIQPAAWLLQSFWLTTHTHADSLNLVINAFSLGIWRGMVQEKGSRDRCSSWTVLHAQCTSALSFGFPISQRNAEALDRWGRKKYHLISYFLRNTAAKNYRNRSMYVKLI